MILLKNNAFYQIDFQVEVHKRLSRSGAVCLGPSETPKSYYIGDCEFYCIENETYSSGCRACINYSLLDTFKFPKHIWPCTHFRADSLPILNFVCTNVKPESNSKQDHLAKPGSPTSFVLG